MRKPRSDSKLDALPREQREKLAEWYGLRDDPPLALKKIRDLLASEFGVATSVSSLSDFYPKIAADVLLARREQAVTTADELAKAASETPGQFDEASIDLLKQRTFELLVKQCASPKDVKALFGLVLQSRAQELEQKQLQLAREKFEFDAAAAALKELPALKKIAGDRSLDQQAKLRAVRERLFGEVPE